MGVENEAGNLAGAGRGESHLMPRINGLTTDAQALTVARAVYDAIQPENVVLFGSRARGDYSPDSDIDLLVLTAPEDQAASTDQHSAWMRAREASLVPRQDLYAQMPGLDLLFMSVAQFQFCRTARNHVAGNALREGVPVNEPQWRRQQREKPHREPDVPDHDQWPDVRQRCRVAYRNLRALYSAVVAPLPDDETIGFHAEQAVENTLKSWISALGLSYTYMRDHNLDALMRTLQATGEDSRLSVATAETLTWLSKYAVTYRYGEAILPLENPLGLLQATLHLVDRVTRETSRLMDHDMTRDAAIAPAYDSLQFLRDGD